VLHLVALTDACIPLLLLWRSAALLCQKITELVERSQNGTRCWRERVFSARLESPAAQLSTLRNKISIKTFCSQNHQTRCAPPLFSSLFPTSRSQDSQPWVQFGSVIFELRPDWNLLSGWACVKRRN
jgi:hypothetical protein